MEPPPQDASPGTHLILGISWGTCKPERDYGYDFLFSYQSTPLTCPPIPQDHRPKMLAPPRPRLRTCPPSPWLRALPYDIPGFGALLAFAHVPVEGEFTLSPGGGTRVAGGNLFIRVLFSWRPLHSPLIILRSISIDLPPEISLIPASNLTPHTATVQMSASKSQIGPRYIPHISLHVEEPPGNCPGGSQTPPPQPRTCARLYQ
jgi:hypothetical protein